MGAPFSCLAGWLSSCHGESEVAWARGGDACDGDEGGARWQLGELPSSGEAGPPLVVMARPAGLLSACPCQGSPSSERDSRMRPASLVLEEQSRAL